MQDFAEQVAALRPVLFDGLQLGRHFSGGSLICRLPFVPDGNLLCVFRCQCGPGCFRNLGDSLGFCDQRMLAAFNLSFAFGDQFFPLLDSSCFVGDLLSFLV